MASTRRDHNRNVFKWEPVEGNHRFTPNAPLEEMYEILELSDPLPCPEDDEDEFERYPPMPRPVEDLGPLSPPNDELMKLAEHNPPPPQWFENDEERPF